MPVPDKQIYIVTRGANFIGSNIVEKLLEKGEKVRVLDNFSTGKKDNLKPVHVEAGLPARLSLST